MILISLLFPSFLIKNNMFLSLIKKHRFSFNVDAPEQTFDAIDLKLPEWIT